MSDNGETRREFKTLIESSERATAWKRILKDLAKLSEEQTNEFIALDLDFVGFIAMQIKFETAFLKKNTALVKLPSWPDYIVKTLQHLGVHLQKKFLVHPKVKMTHASSISFLNAVDITVFKNNFPFFDSLESDVGMIGAWNNNGYYYKGDLEVLVFSHGISTLKDLQENRNQLRNGDFPGVTPECQLNMALVGDYSLANPDVTARGINLSAVNSFANERGTATP